MPIRPDALAQCAHGPEKFQHPIRLDVCVYKYRRPSGPTLQQRIFSYSIVEIALLHSLPSYRPLPVHHAIHQHITCLAVNFVYYTPFVPALESYVWYDSIYIYILHYTVAHQWTVLSR